MEYLIRVIARLSRRRKRHEKRRARASPAATSSGIGR